MAPKSGLVGSSGFVGGVLSRTRAFDRTYNSKNIDEIAGEQFDLLVCAGAPAAMWAANAQPEADAANLEGLFNSLRSAQIRHLVLISTIAVFDEPGAGYTERHARYETAKAYGRNRRDLELKVMDAFSCSILRLPAVFGPGLKKNFIFDLLNPIPSFLNETNFREVEGAFEAKERVALHQCFSLDPKMKMWKFDRTDSAGVGLEAAFARIGVLSRTFTNSQSRFQFYDVRRLDGDVALCVKEGLHVLNVSVEPLRAADIHRSVHGSSYENTEAPLISEDMRSEHGSLFGSSGPYLYSAADTLQALTAFVASRGTE